ncbi:hypothetical protein AQJ58_24650 [Streptomyces sp. DSM 15324]|nr:hypothetical protein AQJ58_24650 [Streptomyces sp. DSM 15324]
MCRALPGTPVTTVHSVHGIRLRRSPPRSQTRSLLHWAQCPASFPGVPCVGTSGAGVVVSRSCISKRTASAAVRSFAPTGLMSMFSLTLSKSSRATMNFRRPAS